jgi:hypothetical protein
VSSEVSADAHTKWYSADATTQVCTTAMYELWLACKGMLKKTEQNKNKNKK